MSLVDQINNVLVSIVWVLKRPLKNKAKHVFLLVLYRNEISSHFN